MFKPATSTPPNKFNRRAIMGSKPAPSVGESDDAPLPSTPSVAPKVGGIGKRILAGARGPQPEESMPPKESSMPLDMPSADHPDQGAMAGLPARMEAIEDSLEAIKQKLGIGSTPDDNAGGAGGGASGF